jgi:hypothetical protein
MATLDPAEAAYDALAPAYDVLTSALLDRDFSELDHAKSLYVAARARGGA